MIVIRQVWLFCVTGLSFFIAPSANCQDSTLSVSNKIITLKEVVVRNNLNVASFIQRVQKDTSFYKAFKNLRVLGFSSLNDIRMADKQGNIRASLQSRTKQLVKNGCRSMQVLEEKTAGDIYDNDGEWNYYTAAMYAGLFFTNGSVCGETNIVQGSVLEGRSGSGIDKHKEQLKRLMFSPGSRIPGVPFIGNKVAIFDEPQSALYDFIIDMDEYNGQNCYLFTVSARSDLSGSEKNQVVINNMKTWFNAGTMQIVARDYDMNYDAGVYDFNVHIEVRMELFREMLVPSLIRYTGNWHAIFRKRETGFFTATLFDFND